MVVWSIVILRFFIEMNHGSGSFGRFFKIIFVVVIIPNRSLSLACWPSLRLRHNQIQTQSQVIMPLHWHTRLHSLILLPSVHMHQPTRFHMQLLIHHTRHLPTQHTRDTPHMPTLPGKCLLN